MKIAVSSEGQHLSSIVDQRFGRAKWFVFYDTETDEFESHKNTQAMNLPQGAGIQAARQVVDREAEVVLTGHCGPKAFQTLRAAGVKVVVEVSGTVKEAIENFTSGALKPTGAPDVPGHW
jgi:predicted Fe-Mo cluster-binding NifX family protein